MISTSKASRRALRASRTHRLAIGGERGGDGRARLAGGGGDEDQRYDGHEVFPCGGATCPGHDASLRDRSRASAGGSRLGVPDAKPGGMERGQDEQREPRALERAAGQHRGRPRGLPCGTPAPARAADPARGSLTRRRRRGWDCCAADGLSGMPVLGARRPEAPAAIPMLGPFLRRRWPARRGSAASRQNRRGRGRRRSGRAKPRGKGSHDEAAAVSGPGRFGKRV